MKNSEHNNYSWIGVILSSVLTVLSVFIILVVQAMVPRFEQLFVNFGSELPALTSFILSNYALGWLAPLLGLSACIYLFATHNKKNTYRKTAVATAVLMFVAAMLWQGIVLIGIYLPIFKMGSVVGG